MPSSLSPVVEPFDATAFSGALLDWFSRAMRPLPWRRTYDPYAVWVSEIMLQQTQMERAVGYFERWMRLFPDIAAVARAEPDAILRAWEGLGYYSRARNLQAAAQRIMDHHNGVFPETMEEIRALPGIGPYTAGAVASIAFNQPMPAIDANVERVFARVFDLDAPVKSPAAQKEISRLLALVLPHTTPRLFNQALMELGALICGKAPRCAACPLAAQCAARRLGIVHERPVPGKKIPSTPLEIVSGVLVHRGKIFIQKRLDTGVWAGFWEFPGGQVEPEETPAAAVVREYAEETEFFVRLQRPLGLVRHGYTRYKIALHCFLCSFANPGPDHPQPALHAATDWRWVTLAELEDIPLPAAHRKLLETFRPHILEALAASA